MDEGHALFIFMQPRCSRTTAMKLKSKNYEARHSARPDVIGHYCNLTDFVVWALDVEQ
jgi:hypothetical protein